MRCDVIARARLTIAAAAALACIVSASAWLRAQTPAAEEARLAGLLASSKLTAVRYTSPNQPVWAITRRGDARGEFKVVVTVRSGILIVFVTVEQKARIRRTPELDQKLLKMNHEYDYVKIGFDDDDDAFVRVDARVRLVDVAEFNETVDQVANVTDTVYLTLKPYLR